MIQYVTGTPVTTTTITGNSMNRRVGHVEHKALTTFHCSTPPVMFATLPCGFDLESNGFAFRASQTLLNVIAMFFPYRTH
ncbi:hypothetical protein TNCV_1210801 [Trichonephila clavipes]|nr:hypothetical protein TNCV_1210801 [Trichonephila clavipes]